MEVTDIFAKSIGMALVISLGTLVVFLMGSVFYIRAKVKGGVYCYLLAANKQLSGFLTKPKSYTVVIGSGENAMKFLIHPTKQFWSHWPPGFPKIIQEPVPTYLFCEGNAEPLDPYDRRALISPESLMKISDEAMLKQTWKDVKESLGLKVKPIDKRIILIIIIAIAVAVFVYFKFIAGGV